MIATFKLSVYTTNSVKINVKSSMARSLPVENLLPQNVGSIKLPNEVVVAQWGTPSVVDHNQLRTMASETVDPIDWSHPPP